MPKKATLVQKMSRKLDEMTYDDVHVVAKGNFDPKSLLSSDSEEERTLLPKGAIVKHQLATPGIA